MADALALKLVACTPPYWDFVRRLRNDPANLAGFIDTTSITEAMQQSYMSQHAGSYRICLNHDLPVGFIGDINGDIRLCVDPAWKNHGIGKFMIGEYVKSQEKDKRKLFAKVKVENQASRRAFESCGFRAKFIIYEI